jgi:hypothetical protein
MCILSSSSVSPWSAASVVAHSCIVLLMSSSGGGGGPFRFRSGFELDESTEVDDSFSRLIRPNGPPLFRPSEEGRGERSPGMCIEGRMSFFCFEAGRISSRSTGTPSETRNNRRIRERTQSGGCSGGGATNCVHNDWLRSERKMDRVSSILVDIVGMSSCAGYMSSR